MTANLSTPEDKKTLLAKLSLMEESASHVFSYYFAGKTELIKAHGEEFKESFEEFRIKFDSLVEDKDKKVRSDKVAKLLDELADGLFGSKSVPLMKTVCLVLPLIDKVIENVQFVRLEGGVTTYTSITKAPGNGSEIICEHINAIPNMYDFNFHILKVAINTVSEIVSYPLKFFNNESDAAKIIGVTDSSHDEL